MSVHLYVLSQLNRKICFKLISFFFPHKIKFQYQPSTALLMSVVQIKIKESLDFEHLWRKRFFKLAFPLSLSQQGFWHYQPGLMFLCYGLLGVMVLGYVDQLSMRSYGSWLCWSIVYQELWFLVMLINCLPGVMVLGYVDQLSMRSYGSWLCWSVVYQELWFLVMLISCLPWIMVLGYADQLTTRSYDSLLRWSIVYQQLFLFMVINCLPGVMVLSYKIHSVCSAVV